MEGLFQLVAQSFARHGLEAIPASDLQPAEPFSEAPLTAVFPEHNYRPSAKTDPVP